MEAKAKGYAQVLWLDAIERKYVEEVGTMNQFFVLDEIIYTAPLTGTVLRGVTRESVIQFTNFLYKSGLIFFVFSILFSRRHFAISLWFPLNKTSGTAISSITSGLV